MSDQPPANTPANASRRAFLLRSEMPPPRVALTERCLAAMGVFCESCRDSCDAGALRFELQLGAAPKPVFDADRCTQCGECAKVCPQDAIRIQPKAPSTG
ncbi:MAG: 4Fe-4S binding protein [Betaproteobacteria bacterium]|nr:4Fe-4S binding protein [Betaproteobacteria bacterium]